MIQISKENIKDFGKVQRLNLINSITGYKPANLIGTKDNQGRNNLAIISSVVHLGSNPALIGFFMRPIVGERHTFHNIMSSSYYTINHVHAQIAERAHFTSAELPIDVSEFEVCGLTPTFKNDFFAPFVAESKLQIGMKLVDKMDIPYNNTILMIGEVEVIYLEDNCYDVDSGEVDLCSIATACISGVDKYHTVEHFATFPYARPTNIPDFK